jgi:pimeloyl-ACP methyl ester carboxylesterase
MPESSVEILGHSIGGFTYRHYAHRAPLAFKGIMTLSQSSDSVTRPPLKFSSYGTLRWLRDRRIVNMMSLNKPPCFPFLLSSG